MAETKPTANQKLRYERERRGWSQQEMADKVGTTPLNVGRWERGVTVPGPHFRMKLSEVFEKSLYELGLVSERSTTSLSSEESSPTQERIVTVAETYASLWNVPYGRNIFFTGREEALDRLHLALSVQAQPIAISQTQAISGLGGIGKTQLAVEYAYRYRDDYSAVLWARAESVDLLVSDFLTLAALLELPERIEQEQRTIVNAVLRWFDTHQGWLLILDNADHIEITKEFIPSSGNGQVLLTTRAFSTGTIAGRIELETMTVEEGTLFLLRRTKRIRGNTPLDSVPESVRSQARTIVEAMDALPLALDQAGAYIEETETSLSDYLKLYRTRRQRLLRTRGQDAVGHPEPVATTWSLSIEKIRHANPAAAELLCLLALLHPDNIPESMIVAGAAELGPVLQPVVSDEFDFNEAIGELHRFSLIKRDAEEKILTIHRLVQVVVQDEMEKQTYQQWTERTVAALDIAFPQVSYEVWSQCERLLPHVLTSVAAFAPQKLNLALASLLYKTATYLYQRVQYNQAEPLFQRALYIWEKTVGPEHPEMATSLNELANLYREQGKYAEAEPLFQRALYIREQALGPEHPDVAHPLHGLATLYLEQGKYAKAEPLFLRALYIREQALGSEHPDVAYTLSNLAVLYHYQGKYAKAEPLFQRALYIREQALGPEHLQTGTSLNNLAEFYYLQDKYEQAEPLFLRALQIWEQAVGSENSYVAFALNGLADLYYRQGRYEQAEPFYQRALQIWEQTLGPEHPQVAFPLNGLANLYREQGKYVQAESFYQRALALRQRQIGSQHPNTAESLHDFACLHEVRNQPEQALALYLQALAIREQQLGFHHPHTVDTRARAAQLLRESGRIEEAVELENIPEQEAMASDQPAK